MIGAGSARDDGATDTSGGWPRVTLLVGLILAVQAAGLWAMGRLAIAKGGTVELWHGAADAGQSQHLADWYTLTHVEHGLLFYVALLLAFPRLSFATRFVLAFLVEGVWELFENTDLVIDRYRESNLANGYRGDTIVNSLVDSVAMAVGFLIASRLPVWGTLALFLAVEAVLAISLRDNLILNVVALVHPIEAIEQWQAAGKLAPK